MRPGPDAGGIEPTEGVHGPVDQFLDRVGLGLVGRIRHDLNLRAQASQLVGQAVLGVAQNKVVIPARHLARQGGHHVRLRVGENHYALLARTACLRVHLRRLRAESSRAGEARQPHASHPQEATARGLSLFLFFLLVY